MQKQGAGWEGQVMSVLNKLPALGGLGSPGLSPTLAPHGQILGEGPGGKVFPVCLFSVPFHPSPGAHGLGPCGALMPG